MSYFKDEHDNWGTNDFHCEDCGSITPHYVKMVKFGKTEDPKCPDCREVHTLLNTRCKHGMIEIFCGICMGDITRRPDGTVRVHDGSNGFGSTPTVIAMESFLTYRANHLNAYRDGIISEREF
jgi:hypothetical protein